MYNHLKNQTSPYLLQHAQNPVDWYPWCEEAFQKAGQEDKPVFLSIGYSTCHWCHVMAHESFENEEIAELLNRHYIAVKVDKEERPDIDSIYMAVCQAFTGRGGWPTSIFMTPDQKPFFAGTYFPATARYGSTGLREILEYFNDKWVNEREELFRTADRITEMLNRERNSEKRERFTGEGLPEKAVDVYRRSFDEINGGFGHAPKFPATHNLYFLLRHYEQTGNKECLRMAETTLRQMYRGGIFDHIGGGFCRYSTDEIWLVPHFEKMLYDNALCILTYSKAYAVTKNVLYLETAERTARYILSEMTSPEGAFYSAQDADSDGEEGKYYVFTPEEILSVLGKENGKEFNLRYQVTEAGNFEGKNILNLLQTKDITGGYDAALDALGAYRRKREKLHLDDKILTFWNSLMIAAMCTLYRVSENEKYLAAAVQAKEFILNKLCKEDTLYVSYRERASETNGFLDDYAGFVFALLYLYDATLEEDYIKEAKRFTQKAVHDFFDETQGGFYFYGKEHETLLFRPKETYDGALPSGNSLMCYNLVRLAYLEPDAEMEKTRDLQLSFMSGEAEEYPSGYAIFLTALSELIFSPPHIVAVVDKPEEKKELACRVPLESVVHVLTKETVKYPKKDSKTTYYICINNTCLPASNLLDGLE